ncbi:MULTISPECIES: MarR family winged helix-turn-helix transcriptional regulator [unclassified Crossiella]|uniref:MarR family winged helix-turn-helix transcriptional regulator n=1 Tax=unclassified Crossiella TaxID=2620835 RepID=UPI001FFEAE86|nr:MULTISPECIES: MarR family winged helix-turn-helix transcriptional regulator [unclassified Crossiella]MCK2244801.1 MarR family winged helix-turn-helix transcriptional regulator [Crossiella sp. S99.2]MCK2258443.1 MarR family winged helix-turn-helix transcriptional regulator [Crossiella sp. S99.1]
MAAQPIDPMALGLLMYRAHQLARAKANHAARPAGIELQHAGVLTTISTGEVHSQRELGRTLGIDKSTLVRIVDDLERRDLVRRQRSDHDRRAYEVVITDEGERRLGEAGELFRAAMVELLAVLDPGEQRQLHDLLARFADQERAGDETA